MRVRLDDDLYRLDRTYLGPPGRPVPVRASYSQWALFFAVLAIAVIVLRLMQVTFGPNLEALLSQLVLLVLVSWGIAWSLRRSMSAERPLLEGLLRVAQELAGPRPQKERIECVHKTVAVQVWAPWTAPRPRRHVRAWWWVCRFVRRVAALIQQGWTRFVVMARQAGSHMTARRLETSTQAESPDEAAPENTDDETQDGAPPRRAQLWAEVPTHDLVEERR